MSLSKPVKEQINDQSEERYHRLFEDAPIGLYRATSEGQIIDVNPALVAILGYPNKEALLSMNAADLYLYPEDRQRWQTLLEKENVVRNFEVQFRRYDGQIIWLRKHARTIWADDKKVFWYEGFVEDISERKQVEAELCQYQEHLEKQVTQRTADLIRINEQRLLAETMSEVALILTSQTDHTAVLDEILHQVGRIVPYTNANIVLVENDKLRLARWQGQRLDDDWLTNLIQPLTDFVLEAEVISSRKPIIISNTHQNPKWIVLKETAWIKSCIMVPIYLRDRVLGILRLDSEEQDHFSAADAARLQPLASAAAIALENAHLFTAMRRQAEQNARLYQETQKQAQQVQQILNSFRAGVIVLDKENCIKLVNPLGEHYLPMLAGASVGQKIGQLGGISIAEILASSQGNQWREITPSVFPRLILEVAARPLAVASEIEGWIIVIRDVTERREIEKRIQQQEKLAAIGQLAAGIAHDFNNILTSMIGFAEMSRLHPAAPKQVVKDMERITQQGQRGAYLVRQILDFARKNVAQKQLVDLKLILEETVRLLRHMLPATIQFEVIIEPGNYTLNADFTQLQQVITNLARNAQDAMPAGGRLEFRLAHLTLTPASKPPLPDMPNGDWLIFSVSDTGIGISPELIHRLFEPFFTTKEVGKGTGLGLAQVDGIIKQHNGYIDVESQLGQGTTFRLYLPAKFNLTAKTP